MALTKVKGSGVEGITNLSNATFLSVDASEVATLLTSAVINSEGGAVTTNIAQGLGKSWVRFNASTGTPAINDSLNASSLTDHATGKHTLVFSNAMGNASYAFSCGGSNSDTDSRYIFNNGAVPATASFRFITLNTDSSARDGTHNSVTIHGDLA